MASICTTHINTQKFYHSAQTVYLCSFQASATMLLKSVVFWGITRRRVVIIFFLSFLLRLLTCEDGTDTLSRNVGKQLPYDAA
jgi:hypothetical protein